MASIFEESPKKPEPITETSEEKTETYNPPVGQDTLLAMLAVTRAIAQDLDDETAVQAKALFADWEDAIGLTVNEGYKLRHSGKLYKTVQETTEITADNVPGEGTEGIYEDIG